VYCNPFFFGRSFPGGVFGESSTFKEAVDNDEYYAILGVSKGATDLEIKRAYRKLAVQKHPDKGGDAEEFKKLNEAYETLDDPEKRRLYDQYGKGGLEQGAGMSGMEDIFSSLFGGLSRRQMVYQIEVSLEELYSGSTKKIQLARRRFVQGRVVAEPITLELPIEKGLQEGQRIVLPGADTSQPGPPEDLIFEIAQKPHPVYSRRNTDLLMEMKLSLAEALCGFKRPVELLSGEIIWVSSQPGEIIGTGSIRVLPDGGMPIPGSFDEYGRLFIRFTVLFPESMKLTEAQVKQLKEILQHEGKVKTRHPKDTDEVTCLEEVDPRTYGKDPRSTEHRHEFGFFH